jgi:hypothetical protein
MVSSSKERRCVLWEVRVPLEKRGEIPVTAVYGGLTVGVEDTVGKTLEVDWS